MSHPKTKIHWFIEQNGNVASATNWGSVGGCAVPFARRCPICPLPAPLSGFLLVRRGVGGVGGTCPECPAYPTCPLMSGFIPICPSCPIHPVCRIDPDMSVMSDLPRCVGIDPPARHVPRYGWEWSTWRGNVRYRWECSAGGVAGNLFRAFRFRSELSGQDRWHQPEPGAAVPGGTWEHGARRGSSGGPSGAGPGASCERGPAGPARPGGPGG